MAVKMKSGRVGAVRPRSVRCVAKASKTERSPTAPVEKKKNALTQVVAGSALAAFLAVGVPAVLDPLPADAGALEPCAKSKAFAKRQKQEVKGLEKRLKMYEPDSAPALAIQGTIAQTKRRFAMYGKQGLLCGEDGLPHLVTTGDWSHAGEFMLPGIGFLYFAGLIGWAGRRYLIRSRESKKPADMEIIIDVPVAFECFGEAAIWPLKAVQELRNGELTESDDKITVSPR